MELKLLVLIKMWSKQTQIKKKFSPRNVKIFANQQMKNGVEKVKKKKKKFWGEKTRDLILDLKLRERYKSEQTGRIQSGWLGWLRW